MNRKKIKSITLAAIFAAIYLIMSALSLIIPVLDGVILIIMPIFATFYAAKYSFKETFLFNFATLILCFLVTVSDPFFSLLYIFPTLVVGDVFGLLYKKKVPYITSFFILTLIYVLTNLFSFYLTKIIYEIDLLKELFNNPGFINDFSLSFLLIFSMLEAFSCQRIVTNELQKFNLYPIKEQKIPYYSYFINLIIGIFCVISLFFWTNLYLFLFLLFMSLSIFSIYQFFQSSSHRLLYLFLLLFYFIFSSIPLIANQRLIYIPLFILIPTFILQIVYLCQIRYNNEHKAKNIKRKEG